jgi:hypothetical protein
MSVYIVKDYDPNLESLKESYTLWYATLNNKEVVVQNDFISGTEDFCSWRLLKEYCTKNKLYVTDLYIQFRSNRITLPPNKNGYFFIKGVLGSFGSDITKQLYSVGYIDKDWAEDDIVVVTKYMVPALIIHSEEERTLENCEKSLIWNQNIQ